MEKAIDNIEQIFEYKGIMSEERMEILKMIADKVITVEEGERLLKALDSGGAQAAERKQGQTQGQQSSWSQRLESFGETMGDAVNELGQMLRHVADETVPDLAEEGTEFWEDETGERIPVELKNGRFPVEPGFQLSIRQEKEFGKSQGTLRIVGSDEAECAIEAAGANNLRVYRVGKRTVVRWLGESMTIHVPNAVAKLKAASMSGTLRLEHVDVDTSAKTMNGSIELIDPGKPFRTSTMSGAIHLEVSRPLEGESKATTMSGNIILHAGKDLEAEVATTTMNGKVRPAGDLGKFQERELPGHRKGSLYLWDRDSKNTLRLKTISGAIDLYAIGHAG